MNRLTACILVFFVMPAFVIAQSDWQAIIIESDSMQYFPALSNPDEGWNLPEFDDHSWSRGKGGIGYSDGDDQTIIDPVNSLYIRKKFVIPPGVDVGKISLFIDYDDAFIAYLNGDEIARSANITEPVPQYNSTLLYDREARMYVGGFPERYDIDTSMLSQGENLLALQILNNGISSSDLSSRIFLLARIATEELLFVPPPEWFSAFENDSGSNLPVVSIHTGGFEIQDDPKIVAHMGIADHGPDSLNASDGPFNVYDGRIAIETRGQSTQMFPKKSYGFETQDSLGNNNNISLLGMPAENDWILYAPYTDKSLLRNALTFEIGKIFGQYYSSRTTFCELYLNDAYQGIYLLMEKIKRDDDRVNIDRLDPVDNSGDELTGGYIFKVDKIDPDFSMGYDGFISTPDPSYPNAMDIIYQYFDPKPDELTFTQKQYLKDFILEAEAVLISDYFDDPEIGYNRYLDASSFVDFILINEISKEVDKYRYSSYFYKKKESKGGEIYAGPIWDFNLGYGNVDYWPEGLRPEGWLFDDVQPYEWSLIFWWARLMEDPWFMSLTATRWKILREDRLSDAALQHKIDSLTSLTEEARIRNFQRWPILGSYIWPNYNWQNNTYEDEVDYFTNWLYNRLAWMDNHLTGDVLNPEITISRLNISGNQAEYMLTLDDERFSNAVLRKKYFTILSEDSSLYIDSVIYQNAYSAIVRIAVSQGTSIAGREFSLSVDHRILNGFRDMETASVLTGNEPFILTEMKLPEIYSRNSDIIIDSRGNQVAGGATISVYDMTGRLRIVSMLTDDMQVIHTQGLDRGIYIVELSSSKGMSREKVVLE